MEIKENIKRVINNLIGENLKYYILPIINFCLLFFLVLYLFITKDINTRAYDKVNELEIMINSSNNTREIPIIIINTTDNKESLDIHNNEKKMQ